MTKYKVSLSVDKNWIDRFDLTFEADSEHEAESMAMIEVKQNLSDYITAYADDESEEQMSCNNCNNEDENETLYWDNELDKPNMVDYTCLCQSCYNKISTESEE